MQPLLYNSVDHKNIIGGRHTLNVDTERFVFPNFNCIRTFAYFAGMPKMPDKMYMYINKLSVLLSVVENNVADFFVSR